MNVKLELIYKELGITEEILFENKLLPCPEPDFKNLEVVQIDFEGKPFILLSSAANFWRKMCLEAERDKVLLQPHSGFRSVIYQKKIIERHLSNGRPLKDILTHIAIPGFSEHHTGRAVDIYSNHHPYLEQDFEKTEAYQWLSTNAFRFNFNLTYPRDNKLGIIFEPWHWCFQEE